MPGFSSGMMGAMTLLGNITGAAIGFFFPVSKTDNKLFLQHEPAGVYNVFKRCT